MAAALGAGLAAMAARFSVAVMADAAEIVAEADRLRGQVLLLSRIDGESYEAVLAALRRPRDDPGRDDALAQALSDAAEPPLAIAELAADAGELAARVADGGNGHLVGDAAAGTYLAQAAALACANLVRINLRGRPGDERIARVEAAVERATRATRRV